MSIDWTKPVEYYYRGKWEPARVLATDVKSVYSAVVAFTVPDGHEAVAAATESGRSCFGGPIVIRNVPVRHVRWWNCYPDRVEDFLLPEDAKLHRYSDCIACIRVEFTEGEGLEP